MRIGAGLLGLGLLAELCIARGALAYYLDDAHRFSVRMQAYSQLGILTEHSERAGCPSPAEVEQAYRQYPGAAVRRGLAPVLPNGASSCVGGGPVERIAAAMKVCRERPAPVWDRRHSA